MFVIMFLCFSFFFLSYGRLAIFSLYSLESRKSLERLFNQQNSTAENSFNNDQVARANANTSSRSNTKFPLSGESKLNCFSKAILKNTSVSDPAAR